MAAAEAIVERVGTLLRLRGRLDRASVAAVWPRALAALDGVQGLDLHAVEALDSAGLALVSLLATRCGTVAIDGSPEGFAELRAAYRLGHGLAFVRD